jgi:hypothetical protein
VKPPLDIQHLADENTPSGKKLVHEQLRLALYMVGNQSRNYHVINVIKTMLPTITGKGSLVGVNGLIPLGRLDLASRRLRPATTISPLLASTHTPISLASHLHLCGLVQKQPNPRRGHASMVSKMQLCTSKRPPASGSFRPSPPS